MQLPRADHPDALLTVAEMAECDRLTIAAGTPGPVLMERAGAAVARAILRSYAPRPVIALCGPGNNGGDGYVVARLLAQAGWPVEVAAMAPRTDDARHHRALWSGPVSDLADIRPGARLAGGRPAGERPAGERLVVDGLFGAGLDRALSAEVARLVEQIDGPVVAIDMPSGIQGDSGLALGPAVRAELTVTFHRAKPGHWLQPGRSHVGRLEIADIGIAPGLLAARAWSNGPDLWPVPIPRADGHKYDRGHVVIRGGRTMTGAARLAARGARRAGAGLVTILADPDAWAVYAADQPGCLVRPLAQEAEAYAAAIADKRLNVLVIGPGNEADGATRAAVEAAASAAVQGARSLVLDAGALACFSGDPSGLATAIAGAPAVLTPHEGEFRRLFGDLPGSRLDRARRAAELAGATVLLKGPDTVVAEPGGGAVVNHSGTAWLASGGTGDVLAGIIAGLLAQGMDAFAAAALGAWMHGAAAESAGPGMIAEDLPENLVKIWAKLDTVFRDKGLHVKSMTKY